MVVVRRAPLEHGSELVVREATPDDLPGLQELHDALSDEDRYRRFFSCFRPDDAYYQRLVTLPERGGAVLVAELGRPDGSTELVGEADFSRLANGNGELAMVVDSTWRGWLGSYLIDALVEVAAERGVPNLEGDVLTVNRPMLAVLRHRGYATTAHPDWTVVRVCVGTGGHGPDWPRGDHGPRVLVEVPGGRWRLEEEARASGLQVMACPGPSWGGPCPLVHGGRCDLVDGADVIVMARPPDDERWRSLAVAHTFRGDPVVLDAGGDPTELFERLSTLEEVDRGGS